jgi:hypothetical protein
MGTARDGQREPTDALNAGKLGGLLDDRRRNDGNARRNQDNGRESADDGRRRIVL